MACKKDPAEAVRSAVTAEPHSIRAEASGQETLTVPFAALDRTHSPLRDELRAAFDGVVSSSGFILGAEVDAFEREFAEASSAAHCVGVGSGTAALALTLLAAGIGPGDEVVVPAHTFIATGLAVVHAGATPVLCDVEADTGLIDAASAEACLTERTAAVVAVHLYGQPCDMDALAALCERHGLFLLEDAAQAHGATYRDRPAGSLGSAAAFSFYPGKNLGALGDGGAVCTDDATLAERVRRLRHLGQRRKGEHVVTGFNERLDGLQAALLRVKLPHLAAANAARRRHAARYDELLPPALTPLTERDDRRGNYHLYPVRAADPAALAAALGDRGVQTGFHYAPALDEQPPIAKVARTPVPLEAARAWAREELSLPMFPELTDEEIEHVMTACSEAIGRPEEGR
jgi:dTDP-4-amino-4,6-dideoxygalactose transaminase